MYIRCIFGQNVSKKIRIEYYQSNALPFHMNLQRKLDKRTWKVIYLNVFPRRPIFMFYVLHR